jgi:FkbM family methyltransferase
MKFLRRFIDGLFYIVHPLFRAEKIQIFLARYISLPYSMAKHLDYRGLVNFKVNGERLTMRSYGTPIELTVFWRGLFNAREGSELKLWSKLIMNADVVFDIGANNGLYALVASSNKKAKIYAFEPVDQVYEMLLENINLNPQSNIEAFKLVVGANTGKEKLFIPKDGWVDIASIDAEFATRFSGDVKEVDVDSITLDEFVENKKISKDQVIVCKIDVEGAESVVLSGMKNLLQSHKISFIAELLNQNDYTKVQKIVPGEYNVFAIKNKKIILCNHHLDGVNNYFFIKTDHPILLDKVIF